MSILHKDNNGVIKEYTCGDSKYNLNYSTSEIDTGMTWIDGKKIYRKVFTFNSDLTLSPNIWTNIAAQTTENNIINAVGIGTRYIYSFPLAGGIANNNLQVISVRNSGDLYLSAVILEYTKTTI